MAHGEKPSRKQDQAIAALLAKPTLPEAAAEVGISVQTLRAWLTQQGFKRAYGQAREGILERTSARLLPLTAEVVATLARNLYGEAPGVEIRAALAILEHAVKGSELLELARRVQDLEERLLPKGEPPCA